MIINPLILQVFLRHLLGCPVVKHNERNDDQVQVIVFIYCKGNHLWAGLSLTLVPHIALLLSSDLPKTLHKVVIFTTSRVQKDHLTVRKWNWLCRKPDTLHSKFSLWSFLCGPFLIIWECYPWTWVQLWRDQVNFSKIFIN